MTTKEKLEMLNRAEECAYAALGCGDIDKQNTALDLLAKIDLERSTLLSKEDAHPVETFAEAVTPMEAPVEAPVEKEDIGELRRQLKAIAVQAKRGNVFDVAGLLNAFGASKLSEIRDEQVAQVLKNAKELMGNAT